MDMVTYWASCEFLESYGQHLHVGVFWNKFCIHSFPISFYFDNMFLVNNLEGKKMGGNNEWRVLLSSLRFLSIVAAILHEDVECT